MKIHTGDTVLVISGKDKGKTGTVLRVLGQRLVVGDINMRTKHVRKTPQQAGQRIRYEASIAASNLMVIDPKTKKPTRIGIRVDEKGHKVRFAKVSGEVIVAVKAPKKKSSKIVRERTKDGKEGTKTTEVEQVAGPSRKPFWKKLSFGSEAVSDLEDTKARPADNAVPEEGRLSESFHHSRGS
ncbi:MAG: 50S ribosomal protein L24 [Candidatus Peribacteraceae bacterium]|nr:50S ribosomal protein L24 [Candidatus Peribacteraceae bacterium]MDD5074939.1 50S ribosomal protein L24 [Candidatus Peribacteraceae bacterium]